MNRFLSCSRDWPDISPALARLIAALCVFCFQGPLSAQLQTIEFEPAVIDANIDEPVIITIQTGGGSPAWNLLFSDNTNRELTAKGDGAYSIEISHQEAMSGFEDNDVNRNFLGYLQSWSGTEFVTKFNVFIEIKDDSIPDIDVRDIAGGIRLGPHMVNFHFPDIEFPVVARTDIANRFYEHFADDFDFLAVVSTPAVSSNRYYARVQNRTQGTGVPIFDNSSAFGSNGRLLGFVMYPITYFFDLAARTLSHEIGHHWINFSTNPKLQNVRPHWPISSLAHSVMGYQTTGQGLTFPYEVVPLGGDQYQLVFDVEPTRLFNGLELYLMGLGDPDNAGSYLIFENQDQALCNLCILNGPVVEFGVADLVASEGERIPAWPGDSTHFRMATIFVSKTRPLTDREMSFYDHFAARGESEVTLPYSEGFAKGTTLPFYLATEGKGTLSTTISHQSIRTLFMNGFE